MWISITISKLIRRDDAKTYYSFRLTVVPNPWYAKTYFFFMYNLRSIIIIIINIQCYFVWLILADFINIDGMGFVIVAIWITITHVYFFVRPVRNNPRIVVLCLFFFFCSTFIFNIIFVFTNVIMKWTPPLSLALMIFILPAAMSTAEVVSIFTNENKFHSYWRIFYKKKINNIKLSRQI